MPRHAGTIAARLLLLALLGAGPAWPVVAAEEVPAKQLFGARPLPADMKPRPVGFYSRGCLAGGVAIPVDGPSWQVMRLSRNRRWGHPDLIAVIEDLSIRARRDGWNGLMVGDISQPRGGPMLTGHASHQIGLDADIWFMPMPDRRLSYREREELSAVSVLKDGAVHVDDSRWTRAHTQLLRNAASYPQVERILVHPGVKKKLCDTLKGDRSWLARIRPYYGHHYHFHIRIACPQGAADCKAQAPVPAGDGCDKSLDWWFTHALVPKKPSMPEQPATPRYTRLSDLPKACVAILDAPSVAEDEAQFPVRETAFTAPAIDIPRVDPAVILASKPIEAKQHSGRAVGEADMPADIPVPTPRPVN